MKKPTEDNVKAAFAGESQAHVKYLAFAAAAEKERLANIARLFRAASYSEQVHATNHLGALKGVGQDGREPAGGDRRRDLRSHHDVPGLYRDRK